MFRLHSLHSMVKQWHIYSLMHPRSILIVTRCGPPLLGAFVMFSWYYDPPCFDGGQAFEIHGHELHDQGSSHKTAGTSDFMKNPDQIIWCTWMSDQHSRVVVDLIILVYCRYIYVVIVRVIFIVIVIVIYMLPCFLGKLFLAAHPGRVHLLCITDCMYICACSHGMT